VLERDINERLTLGVELFGNSPKELVAVPIWRSMSAAVGN
jgi:hypothetical protein